MMTGSINSDRPNGWPEQRVEREVDEHRREEVEHRLDDRDERKHPRGNEAFMIRLRPPSTDRAPAIMELLTKREEEDRPHEVGDDEVPRAGAGPGGPHDGPQQEVHRRHQQRIEDHPDLPDRRVVVLAFQVGAREVPDEAPAAPEIDEVRDAAAACRSRSTRRPSVLDKAA